MGKDFYEDEFAKHGIGGKKVALDLLPKGADVLEVGCATGYITRILVQEKGCQVDGVEINNEAAKKAKKYTRRLFVGSIEDEALLRGIENRYDAILLLDVLEHLVDPVRALRMLKPLLKEKGCIIAIIPNIAHWKTRFKLLFGRFDYKEHGLLDRGHLRFFTRKTAREAFVEAGLVIIREDVCMRSRPYSLNGIVKGLLRKLPTDLFVYQFMIVAN